MGVHGLWRLIEPSGKPVPPETLENKILAVDISIWLHQAIKGFQDAKGAPIPNAHLLGIFHRVCKLLYYRIQPIFVFDGGVPVLKRQTIARRNEQKSKTINDANRLQKQLLNSLLKHSAINAVLSEKVKANLEHDIQKTSRDTKNENNMYVLPPTEFELTESSSEEECPSSSDHSNITKHWDLHTIDAKGSHFKSLPVNVRHEILSELKETRKQSSWGRIHELPTKSDDFSGYQMKRLLKRHSVQTSLEEAEKEMGGFSLSLGELETLLTNHGVITSTSIVTSRIASDENKRYIYIKNLKQAIEEASTAPKNIENEIDIEDHSSNEASENEKQEKKDSKTDQEYEKDVDEAIRLSLQEEPTTSKEVSVDSVEFNDVEVEKSETSNEQESNTTKSLADQEYERDFEEAIRLSLQEQETVSKDLFNASCSSKFDNSIIIEEDEGNYSDSSMSESELADKMLASAKSYMTEYSGLTPNEILKIIKGNSVKSNKMLRHKIVQTLKGNSSSRHDIKQSKFNRLQNKFDVSKEPNNIDIKTSSTSDAIVPLTKSNEVTVHDIYSNISNSIQSKSEANISELNNTKSDVNPIMNEMMSDSDTSDDFLEVESSKNEVSSKKLSENIGKEQPMEITIEKVSQLDDDMFSDIFEEAHNNETIVKKRSISQPQLRNIHKAADTLTSSNTKIALNTCLIQTHNINNTTENLPTATKDEDSEVQMKTKHDKIENIALSESSTSKSVVSDIRKNNEKNSELLKEILNPLTKEDQSSNLLTTSKLKNLKNDLAKESNQLMKEKSVKERLASNITEQMCQEAQELLQLFGVPYIIAPMEAEAQCAFLNEIGLTDGTITDDSDIWLFGGKTVYKNFFNQSKNVLEFQAESIQHSFKLSRYEMILLALLVGSDYTTGIQGIGPVTALEILAAFPPPKNEFTISEIRLLSGLKEFRKWFYSEKITKRAKASLRNKLKNVTISEQFPSLQVVQAYLEPTVETSRDPFSWQKPDINSLMEYARHKFAWPQKKSEEILKPVLMRIEETRVQTKITNYFKTKHKIQANIPENKMSKRVKVAISKIGTNDSNSDELSDIDMKKQPKEQTSTDTKTKPKARTRKSKKKNTDDLELLDIDMKDQPKEGTSTDKKTKPKGRTRKIKKKNTDDSASNTNEDIDNDIKVLKETKKLSRGKIKEMKIQMNEMLLRAEASANAENTDACSSTAHIHRKEIIHQRERDKGDLLKSKLKAIEVFRKSKHGPGFTKTRQKVTKQLKQDAELSESSD